MRRAKELGFRLGEIAELLSLTDDRHADMKGVKRKAEERVNERGELRERAFAAEKLRDFRSAGEAWAQISDQSPSDLEAAVHALATLYRLAAEEHAGQQIEPGRDHQRDDDQGVRPTMGDPADAAGRERLDVLVGQRFVELDDEVWYRMGDFVRREGDELFYVDRRADLFSAATVLWECLTGRRLFPGKKIGRAHV